MRSNVEKVQEPVVPSERIVRSKQPRKYFQVPLDEPTEEVYYYWAQKRGASMEAVMEGVLADIARQVYEYQSGQCLHCCIFASLAHVTIEE